ncbi:Plasmodium exported protein, unknown function [Plasmodium gonderi]|uniref:Uncharacterized protein n=1 Tax=Plasmodium gonderi TaxID=77519 RepID=A0A1Y1JDM3_PLAGO|nr:Plasmodium exported protein, unknown function [Plasmodium gonderi]GAW79415.1 Plasmodium exported protein, unknown function [Plasmodium gonderi]
MAMKNPQYVSNHRATESYYGTCKSENKKVVDSCGTSNVGMLNGCHKIGGISIPLFFAKVLIFVNLVLLLQPSSHSMAIDKTRGEYHEGTTWRTNEGQWENVRKNRILIECLKNSNKTYDKLEQNIVEKIENIYEEQRRNIVSKIMAFIKKIDLIVEKEIIKTLKYIEAEKDEPIKSGLNFLEKVKNFFRGFKIFSTPVLGTLAAFTAYYFKSKAFTAMVFLTVSFLPFISTCYLAYKIFKIRSEMSK